MSNLVGQTFTIDRLDDGSPAANSPVVFTITERKRGLTAMADQFGFGVRINDATSVLHAELIVRDHLRHVMDSWDYRSPEQLGTTKAVVICRIKEAFNV